MKNLIRSLAFRFGVKTTDTILGAYVRVAEDLEALAQHFQDTVRANTERAQALIANNEAHLAEARKAANAAANIRTLVG